MRVEWHGQSAFRLSGKGKSVFIDPFGDLSGLESRGITVEYPPLDVDDVDLLLVTHEHGDHNAVEVVRGEPVTLRSTAGRHESPLGEVLGVASEHDRAAGTERGPNTIFAFDLDGVRVAHFGDFGQAALRPEQADALRGVELLLIPIGAGPTIDAAGAAAVVEELSPRWVVPMHYRSAKVDGFLETEDRFLSLMESVTRFDEPHFELDDAPDGEGPHVLVPAAP